MTKQELRQKMIALLDAADNLEQQTGANRSIEEQRIIDGLDREYDETRALWKAS